MDNRKTIQVSNDMNVLIAIDSFKGSLTSLEAGRAAAEGIKRVFPNAVTEIRPVADGGEGTADALTEGLGGTVEKAEVTGPSGKKVTARYGILPDGTAVIEMAAASGLTLIPASERDPMHTTSFGTGELIRSAIEKGCRRFIIGIGGSATNDGGIGCLQALGFGMLDENGRQVSFGASGLAQLHDIDMSGVMPQLKECTFNIACDVKNPLCGEKGCSKVFARQKGADDAMIEKMDALLMRYAELTKSFIPTASPDVEGAGAAGGMGFALMNYLGAEMHSGISLILDETGFGDAVKNADIVITGEGCLDSQTAMGKAPAGIAAIAKKYGRPVIAISGIAGKGAEKCNSCGIDAFFPVLRRICTAEEAMEKAAAAANVSDTAEQIFRLLRIKL